MQVTLATATQKVLEKPCSSVVLPASSGQLEILPGHAALLTRLGTGEVKIGLPGEAARLVVHVEGGFVHVGGDVVRILADKAEMAGTD